MAKEGAARKEEPTPQEAEPKPPPGAGLARRPGAGLQRIDAQELIRVAIETNAGVETMERLVALAKDVRAAQAREAWYSAMAEFQRGCPKIIKSETASISIRGGGSYSYSYAPLDGILRVVQPLMGPLGLSISWRTRSDRDVVAAVCRVSHELGHFEESGEVVMPVPAGDIGANPPQRVGIAMTYAKRYALLSAIGLAPQSDDDARTLEERQIKKTRRASEAAEAPAEKPKPAAKPKQDRPGEDWVGVIVGVDVKKTPKWTLHTIRGDDGQEFSTFDSQKAQFAREAGSSPVAIRWEPVVSKKDAKKTYKSVMSIEPHIEREPGDEPSDVPF